MTNTVIVTLGRTQPPHKAHINMLMNAYLNLKPGDKLVHIIGSTNVEFKSTGKNILSFEERQDVFFTCLQQALETKLKHAVTAEEIKQKFQCVPLPDFSDNTATFPTKEEADARANAIAKAKTFFALNEKEDVQFYTGYPSHSSWKAKLKDDVEERLYQFVQQRKAATGDAKWGEYFIKDNTGAPLTKQERPVYGHGLNYVAWGINALNVLKQSVPASTDGSVPEVIYEVCGKDSGTQEYIDLLEFLAQHYQNELGFTFKVKLTPVELSNNEAINATRIRADMLAMVQKGLDFEKAKIEIDSNPNSAIHFLPEYSFMKSYNTMRTLAVTEAMGKHGMFGGDQAAVPAEQPGVVEQVTTNNSSGQK